MSLNDVLLSTITGNTTVGALTLAVNSATGSDTPTGTRKARLFAGDYSAEPFATIQAAIDALPQYVVHTTNINVAAGNYAGFEFRGRNLSGNVYVNGVQEVFTPTTGPSSGTASSGTNRSLTLTGAGWTAGNLEGKFVEITAGQGAGQSLIIADNDTQVIRTAGLFSPSPNNTSVFRITEPTVKITSAGPNVYWGIYVTGCLGYVRVQDMHVEGMTYPITIYSSHANLGLLRMTAKGGYFNFVGQEALRCSWSQVGSLGSTYYGMAFLTSSMAANVSYEKGWFVKDVSNPSYDGIYATSCLAFGAQGIWIKNCGNNGVYASNLQLIFYDIIIDGCKDGLWVSDARARVTRIESKNNTYRGIASDYGGRIDLFGTVSGAGNGTWGIAQAGAGGFITLSSLPTITGSSGDTTVDGTTAKTWSVDFATAGSYVHHDPRGNHTVRFA